MCTPPRCVQCDVSRKLILIEPIEFTPTYMLSSYECPNCMTVVRQVEPLPIKTNGSAE